MENVTIYDYYRKILELCYEKQSAHVGSNLSVAPILWDVYKSYKDGDIVILSKGHAAIAMYAILLLKNIATKEQIDKNYCGHITTKITGVYWSTGSLGHGLSVAIGCAIASPDKNVTVILSDGELDEGSTMEAIKFVDQMKPLPNLKIIIDNNGFSATKKTLPSHFDKFETYKVCRSLKGSKFLPKSMLGLVSHYKKLSKESYDFSLESIRLHEEAENNEKALC